MKEGLEDMCNTPMYHTSHSKRLTLNIRALILKEKYEKIGGGGGN
jgi:hypothetical protein